MTGKHGDTYGSGLCAGLAFLTLAWALAASGAESPWAGYRFAPDALVENDLSSDTDWTLSLDGGAPRPIKVTAGGWNSDRQQPQIPSAAVRDNAVYERSITIPETAKGQTVKILFGGCNYGAEVWLDGHKIVEHHAPMTPFAADITEAAAAGKSQVLRVKAYTRMHFGLPPKVPAGFDFNTDIPGVPKQYNGHTKFAYGLTGHVRLAVYPPVHISGVFVRPSVAGKSLACGVWIANASKLERTVDLKAAFAPWGNRAWNYPLVPQQTVRIAPGATQQAALDGIPWDLGPESCWWPNIPFREDYAATLHWLKQLGCNHVIYQDDIDHLDPEQKGYWTVADIERAPRDFPEIPVGI
ncbi:MAG: sugar-binding domain-containing protein [Planctomycetota bacterium]